MIAGLLWRIGPWFALALAGVVIWGLYGRLAASETKLAAAHAVIEQREADMKMSALLIAQLQGRVQQIDATAAPVRERIIHVPVTTSCGPAIAAAAAGVRDLLAGPGGSTAGRQPAVAVRAPDAAGR